MYQISLKYCREFMRDTIIESTRRTKLIYNDFENIISDHIEFQCLTSCTLNCEFLSLHIYIFYFILFSIDWRCIQIRVDFFSSFVHIYLNFIQVYLYFAGNSWSLIGTSWYATRLVSQRDISACHLTDYCSWFIIGFVWLIGGSYLEKPVLCNTRSAGQHRIQQFFCLHFCHSFLLGRLI